MPGTANPATPVPAVATYLTLGFSSALKSLDISCAPVTVDVAFTIAWISDSPELKAKTVCVVDENIKSR